MEGVEVSREGFCQREMHAMCAFCLGMILVPITMGVVFWNENDEVINYATAAQITDATVLNGCLPSMSDNGKLVYASCNVHAPDLAGNLPPQLSPFLKSYTGASISWYTELYQWSESSSTQTKKNNHGGTTKVTTYSCSRGWTSSSGEGNFRCPQVSSSPNAGHGFPSGFSRSSSIQAPEYSVTLHPPTSVMVGNKSFGAALGEGIGLDQNLAQQLPYEDLSGRLQDGPGGGQYDANGGSLAANMLTLSGSYLTTSRSPRIGDVRINMNGRSSTHASVAAQQGGACSGSAACLGPYPSQKFGWFGKHTKALEQLYGVIYTPAEFLKQWESDIAQKAMIIRFITFLVMVLAFEMIIQPLSVAADLLRVFNYCTCCLGSLLDDVAQCCIHTAAFFAALFLWFITFGLAWVVARPLYGICILIVNIAIAAVVIHFGRQWSAKRKAAREPFLQSQQAERGVAVAPAPMQFAQPQPQQSAAERISGFVHSHAPAEISQQFDQYAHTGQPAQQQQPYQQPPPYQQPVQPIAHAVAQPVQMMQMNVTCPAGVGPGGLVSIQTPSGQMVNVTVPANVSPNQMFTVQVPS